MVFPFWADGKFSRGTKLGHTAVQAKAHHGSPWLTLEQWQLRTTYRHGNCSGQPGVKHRPVNYSFLLRQVHVIEKLRENLRIRSDVVGGELATRRTSESCKTQARSTARKTTHWTSQARLHCTWTSSRKQLPRETTALVTDQYHAELEFTQIDKVL